MLDSVQNLIWSFAYVLIIIAGWRSREQKLVSMPYVAGVLNIGWELCALQQSQGAWGHVLWLGLNSIIYTIGFFSLKNRKQKAMYVAMTYFATLGHWFLFSRFGAMLVTSYIADLVMTSMFLLHRKRLSPVLKVPIAFFKLLGSAVGAIYYAPMSPVVAVLTSIVFVCNVVYLTLCCREHPAEEALAFGK